jgi:hypothetical protein
VKEETQNKTARIVCVPDEIQTWHLPHNKPTFSLFTYKSKGIVVLVHTTKVYGGTGEQLHTFLNSAVVYLSSRK